MTDRRFDIAIPMHVIKHCAKECEYQRSGEMSVFWMLEAWAYAKTYGSKTPSIADVKALGCLVEPKKNANGFRLVGVRVGASVKMPPAQVPSAMVRLWEHGADLTPEEFFREYEEIHPFVDGNGRTGNIIFNWLKGTLDEPEMPPDFWHQDRVEGAWA